MIAEIHSSIREQGCQNAGAKPRGILGARRELSGGALVLGDPVAAFGARVCRERAAVDPPQ
jgi:hypothetical protein